MYKRIKNQEKRVPKTTFSVAVINSVLICYSLGIHLAVLFWHQIGNIALTELQTELLLHLPAIIGVITAVVAFDRILSVMISITLLSSNCVGKIISKLDYLYWRRTKQEGKISLTIFQIQTRLGSLDPIRKRQIIAVSCCVSIITWLWHVGII
tara:strand:+ start:4284 stop:4742 length:459 start_codon:yes stop_codon:yes gene_type:complete